MHLQEVGTGLQLLQLPRAAELLETLSERLAASAGAACHANAASVSAVLRALRVPPEFAVGTLRLSTGRHTTLEEVALAADLIAEEARRQWGQGDGAAGKVSDSGPS